MQKIEFIDDSENETGGRNLKPVLTQGRKENEACKRFMTQASPRRSYEKRNLEEPRQKKSLISLFVWIHGLLGLSEYRHRKITSFHLCHEKKYH